MEPIIFRFLALITKKYENMFYAVSKCVFFSVKFNPYKSQIKSLQALKKIKKPEKDSKIERESGAFWQTRLPDNSHPGELSIR